MELNEDQQNAFEYFKQGKNLFISGPGGVGKSFLIKYLVKYSFSKNKKVQIIAPTGIAAINIQGRTIHNLFGINIRIPSYQEYLNSFKPKIKEAIKIISDLDILIIDEISMVHLELFKFIHEISEIIKKRINKELFQIVVLGDFFQLPPIDKEFNGNLPLLFETEVWRKCQFQIILLNKPMRQNKDIDFFLILNKIRVSNIDNEIISFFNEISKNKKDSNYHYIKLFSLNKFKDIKNEKELKKIEGNEKKYISEDSGEIHLLKDCPALKEITLKINSTVMLIYNQDTNYGLINGSIGKVIEMSDESVKVKFEKLDKPIIIEKIEWKIEQIKDKKIITKAIRKQIPLILAYAVTIHKSQGLTFDHLEVDLNGIFTPGQLYVSLSRNKTKEGLVIKNFKKKYLIYDKRVLDFYKNIDN
jgi:ATP-dependent DNA helicase PIF1